MKNGKVYIVTVWMSSMVPDENTPGQCKCSSVALGDSGVELVADKVQLTDNQNTDRPCNHPHIISDGSEYAVRRFGRARNIRLARVGEVGRIGLKGPFDLVVCAEDAEA